MGVPKLTADERSGALAKAQEMRSKRMELRKKLKAGEVTLPDLMKQVDDEVVGRMRVRYLLESLPQVGKITAEKIMQEIGIDESRRIQGLGNRQMAELMAKLS